VSSVIRCTTMFCPNCGAPEQSPDAYCKKCGAYLRDASFRGWLLGGNNPGKAAWSIATFSVFAAALCVCVSVLIMRAERSGDSAYLKYAFVLCWAVIGYLVTLSLMCFRLWRKVRRAQSGLNASARATSSGGFAHAPEGRTKRLSDAEVSAEAATELLSPTPRESGEYKEAR
jgi:hypothetical protein